MVVKQGLCIKHWRERDEKEKERVVAVLLASGGVGK